MPLTRLSLEERIRLVRLYSMYEKATHIQKAWKKEFGTDPPSRKTIAALNKKFDETGSVADLSRSGRPKSSRTEEKVALVQAALKKDPSRSIRSLSTELGVNKAAVHRIKQDTEKKKSALGAEIRRLKEKIADLQRKLNDGTGNHSTHHPPAVDPIKQMNFGYGPCMSMATMEQYIIQKHEMFESTLSLDDDSMSGIEPIPTPIPKMDLVSGSSAPARTPAQPEQLPSNEEGQDSHSQAARLTAGVAAVMRGLDMPRADSGEGEGMNSKSVEDDLKSYQAALAQELHHPNTCPQHPIGCHMCYITNVN